MTLKEGGDSVEMASDQLGEPISVTPPRHNGARRRDESLESDSAHTRGIRSRG